MKRLFTFLLFTTFTSPIFAFKVVGYLPSYREYALGSIDFSKLTHVMVSFVNPDTAGNFSYSGDLTAIKIKAAANDCKVFISIGGGGLSTEIEETYEKKTATTFRSGFVSKLVSFAKIEGVDGIDVDLEGSMVQMATYDDFVQELIDSAHASGIEVSAALAKWTGGSIDSETIEKFDFINIMAYDLTGPWTGPGQHSPMSQAQGNVNYWVLKGAKKENLVLGLPFYGWEFKDSGTDAKTWCQIVSEHSDNLNDDQVINDHIKLYYNGKKTIKDKIQFVKDNNAGGVMIWEVGQDCFNDNSLLNVVDEKVHEIANVEFSNQIAFNIFPNPVIGKMNIEVEGAFDFQILDISGKKIISDFNVKVSSINLEALNSRAYIFMITQDGATSVTRLVKK